MCFFDSTDTKIMEAKNNIYMQDSAGQWVANNKIMHRMMSNNSVAYDKKPTFEDLIERFKTIRHSAEGNFYNLETARKRKANCKISNP